MSYVVDITYIRNLRDLAEFKESKGPHIQEVLRALSNYNLIDFAPRAITKIIKQYSGIKRRSMLPFPKFEADITLFLSATLNTHLTN